MPNRQQQGTGKHSHKSAQEPVPHHEAGHHGGHEQSGGHQHSGTQEHQNRGSADSPDLKQREYKDAQGNIHHHTRTAGKSDKE